MERDTKAGNHVDDVSKRPLLAVDHVTLSVTCPINMEETSRRLQIALDKLDLIYKKECTGDTSLSGPFYFANSDADFVICWCCEQCALLDYCALDHMKGFK